MDSLDHATNAELLAKLAGKLVADALIQHYGGLTSLAQASFDELQLIKGVGQSKAAAIKSAFLLAQRLTKETYADAPLRETPEPIATSQSLQRTEPHPPDRKLKIEAEGDSWKSLVKPKIRLMGRWLERAGFAPGHRVQVTSVAPGVIELRSPDASTVNEMKQAPSEQPNRSL
jgi:hypothetical protein